MDVACPECGSALHTRTSKRLVHLQEQRRFCAKCGGWFIVLIEPAKVVSVKKLCTQNAEVVSDRK